MRVAIDGSNAVCADAVVLFGRGSCESCLGACVFGQCPNEYQSRDRGHCRMRARVIRPKLNRAHAAIGNAKYFIGRAEETEAHIKEALRLSPRDTGAHVWMAVAGIAKLVL